MFKLFKNLFRKKSNNENLRLIWGVGFDREKKLKLHGFNTLQDIIRKPLSELRQVPSIGNHTSVDYMAHAKALLYNKHIRKRTPHILPKKKVEMFIDLEDNGNIIYLIGVLIRENENIKYKYFLEANYNGECGMLEEFITFVKKYDDYVIYHYGDYDNTQLNKMTMKYNKSDDDKKIILSDDILFNMFRIIQYTVAFPIDSLALKSMSKWLEFKRCFKDMDWRIAQSKYHEYINTNNETEKEKLLIKICGYNEDDCRALMAVKDWYKNYM